MPWGKIKLCFLRKARGYFKNVFGEVIDQFTAWSGSAAPDPSNTPPMVAAGGDAGGDEGTTVNLAATFTDADVDDTHTATIDWGDASGLEPGTVTEAGGAGMVDGSHVYADNGVYTVTVTVNDGHGGIASDSYAVTVTNVAPTANAGGPYAGNEGAGVSFNGSATDPGADTFTFEWDFDYDGSIFTADGSGASPTHVYTLSGSYTAALRVTDDDGGSDLATATVDVADADPVAGFTFSPSAPLVGEVVTFTDASTSYDGITTWQWDFDVAVGLSIDSEVQNPTHTYQSAGTYTVRLTVGEADGDVSVVEQQVVVSEEPVINTAPTASGVTITGTAEVGQQLTGNYTYGDVDGDEEGSSTYRWLRDGAPISGATAQTYTPVAADQGTLIVFEVTPVAVTGASPGAPAPSPAVRPVAAAVDVAAIWPNTVVAGSPIYVTITGSGLAPEASLTIENGTGGPPPDVSNVVVQDANTIPATVTTKRGGPRRNRLWDVRVTNPDGSSAALVGGLTVTSTR